MKSLEDPNISFLLTSPFQWYQEYTLELDEALKKKLQLEKPEDTLVLCIVTIKGSLVSSTINLLAPLIINVNELMGTQYVFHGQTNYRTNSSLVTGTQDEEVE
ncbi:Flagellar assembly factor FliW [compost metagenome]